MEEMDGGHEKQSKHITRAEFKKVVSRGGVPILLWRSFVHLLKRALPSPLVPGQIGFSSFRLCGSVLPIRAPPPLVC